MHLRFAFRGNGALVHLGASQMLVVFVKSNPEPQVDFSFLSLPRGGVLLLLPAIRICCSGGLGRLHREGDVLRHSPTPKPGGREAAQLLRGGALVLAVVLLFSCC